MTESPAFSPSANKHWVAAQHERDVARSLDGTCQPGSGAFDRKGDVLTEFLLLECKQTGLKSYRIRTKDVEKISRQAASQERSPSMAFRFDSMAAGMERDWLMIPLRVAAELLRRNKQSEATPKYRADDHHERR